MSRRTSPSAAAPAAAADTHPPQAAASEPLPDRIMLRGAQLADRHAPEPVDPDGDGVAPVEPVHQPTAPIPVTELAGDVRRLMGGHWLGTFAVYLTSQRGLTKP